MKKLIIKKVLEGEEHVSSSSSNESRINENSEPATNLHSFDTQVPSLATELPSCINSMIKTGETRKNFSRMYPIFGKLKHKVEWENLISYYEEYKIATNYISENFHLKMEAYIEKLKKLEADDPDISEKRPQNLHLMKTSKSVQDDVVPGFKEHLGTVNGNGLEEMTLPDATVASFIATVEKHRNLVSSSLGIKSKTIDTTIGNTSAIEQLEKNLKVTILYFKEYETNSEFAADIFFNRINLYLQKLKVNGNDEGNTYTEDQSIALLQPSMLENDSVETIMCQKCKKLNEIQDTSFIDRMANKFSEVGKSYKQPENSAWDYLNSFKSASNDASKKFFVKLDKLFRGLKKYLKAESRKIKDDELAIQSDKNFLKKRCDKFWQMRRTTAQVKITEFSQEYRALKRKALEGPPSSQSSIFDPISNLFIKRLKNELEDTNLKLKDTQIELEDPIFLKSVNHGDDNWKNKMLKKIQCEERVKKLVAQTEFNQKLIDGLENYVNDFQLILEKIDKDLHGLDQIILKLKHTQKNDKEVKTVQR